jgi:hypothetical protein
MLQNVAGFYRYWKAGCRLASDNSAMERLSRVAGAMHPRDVRSGTYSSRVRDLIRLLAIFVNHDDGSASLTLTKPLGR